MITRSGWERWYVSALRWLATAGVVSLDAATVADLRALFDRDFEPRDAAFALVDEVRVEVEA